MRPPVAESAGRARGFGLDVVGDLDALGLPSADGPPSSRTTTVELVSKRELDAYWRPGEAESVFRHGRDPDRPEQAIERHPELGYRLTARDFGSAVVELDGRRVHAARPAAATRRWRRFLVGRILPAAAALQGLEIMHASAVSFDHSALAFTGPSGVGKTSLALHLVLRGARFVTDDVLAVEMDDGLRAHPGAAVAGVRRSEAQRLTTVERRRLGDFSGHGGKTYLTIDAGSQSLPLEALYFLERREEGDVAIERVSTPGAPELLSSSFMPSIRTRRRTLTHLELWSRIARDVVVFRVGVPAFLDASGLAAEVERHLRAPAEP